MRTITFKFTVIAFLSLFVISCKDNNIENAAVNKVLTSENNTDFKSAAKITENRPTYTSEDIEFLKSVGMNSSYTVKDNLELVDRVTAEKYEKKYIGCKFLSNEYMEKFLQEKDLVMGELSKFIGAIPPECVTQFKTNLEYAKSVDEKLAGYYFIRKSRQGNTGEFLQKINTSEILPHAFELIEGGPGGVGQSMQDGGTGILPPEKYAVYKKKYKVSEIIVDHNTGVVLKIIAPKELFNLDGTVVVDRKILEIKRDPAIIFQVQEGWMVLTAWK